MTTRRTKVGIVRCCLVLFDVIGLSRKCKYSIFNFTCRKNLLTRQRALFKSKRRGDSGCAIATRSLASEPYAIEGNGREIAHVLSPLASLASEPYVIDENGKEIAMQRVSDTDLVHGSSTWVQNRVQLKEKQSRSRKKLLELMSNYENLSETVKALCYVRESIRLCSETQIDTSDTEDDLGNKSKVNTSYNLRTYDNHKEKQHSIDH